MALQGKELKEVRTWNMEDLRNFCIRRNYYTRGDCKAYDRLLKMTYVKPDMDVLRMAAEDIARHSNLQNGETVVDIMNGIMNEVVNIYFQEETKIFQI